MRMINPTLMMRIEDEYDYEEDDHDEHVIEVRPQTQGERMALESSMTYLRRTHRKT